MRILGTPRIIRRSACGVRCSNDERRTANHERLPLARGDSPADDQRCDEEQRGEDERRTWKIEIAIPADREREHLREQDGRDHAGDAVQAADRPLQLAPRSAPPGAHVLGVRVEVRARDNPKLGYVSEQSFSVVLPESKKTTVEITIDEDGDLPSYNPTIEIEVSQ